MAGKRKEMKDIRNILSMLSQGYGTKHISKVLGCSRNTVKSYRDTILEKGLDYTQILKQPEEELERHFQAKVKETDEKYLVLHSSFAYVGKELEKTGVNLQLLWSEYKLHNPDGYSYPHYCRYYREYTKKKEVCMHFEHTPGDRLYIDYTGKKIPYVDRETGEIHECEIYISTMGYSQLTYIEATHGQSMEECAQSTNNALRFYGGVPKVLVPDNLKSTVTRADNYEAGLNSLFEKLANHYGCEVLPARARKPRDKAIVEKHVSIIYTRVFARLRNTTFFSMAEIKKAIRGMLEIHNATPFQGKETTRREMFDEEERHILSPLPVHPFEIMMHRNATVMKNCHIQLMEDKHYYSVPYRYVGEKVTIAYNSMEVRVYLKGECIAYHTRDAAPFKYTTVKDHLASTHRFVSDWSPEFFLNMAGKISPDVREYIGMVLSGKNYPEQLYRSCIDILAIGKKAGRERLVVEQNFDKTPQRLPAHDNIRGASYYSESIQTNE